jgi:hypothetical protein
MRQPRGGVEKNSIYMGGPLVNAGHPLRTTLSALRKAAKQAARSFPVVVSGQ